MSRTAAMRRAEQLASALERRGVKVSIEIQQGRPGTPNDRWYDDRWIGSMGHHIVSRRSQGLTPGLALVKRGRPDVPGPLCNGYLGFDNVARIICMGWANHPGAGGPYTLPRGRIPKDQGRPYLFGWEIEGGIVEADWTPSFRALMGKCHAATLAWLGLDERSHIEHKTWAPSRKIDRLNYTLTGARNELKPHLKIGTAPPPPPERTWFDMATLDMLKKALRDVIAEDATKGRIGSAVWGHPIARVDPSAPNQRGTTASAGTHQRYTRHRGDVLVQELAPKILEAVSVLGAQVQALADGDRAEVQRCAGQLDAIQAKLRQMAAVEEADDDNDDA